MSEKADLIDMIGASCVDMLSTEQIQTLEGRLYLKLKDYDVVKQETALSTVVEKDNSEYIAKFLAIKAVAGRSQNTLTYYKNGLNKFFGYTPKSVKAITTDDIRLYLAKRETWDGVSKVTLQNELRVLRSFFTTMLAEEIIQRNPTAKIEKIKTPKQVKEPLTEFEIEKLRQACDTKFDSALLEVFLSTGCRVGEIANAKRSDVKGDKMKVLGKGNKERIVYLNAKALWALNRYLDSRNDDKPGLFISPKSYGNDYISKSALEEHIRRLGKKAGVENVHPHRLRRTAATMALRRGMPIEQVSLMLGHEELTTTQIYARSSDEDVYMSHKKYLV